MAQAALCYMGTQLKGSHTPFFGPCLLWPNGRPSHLLLSTCNIRCLSSTLGVTQLEFHQYLWRPKARVPTLSHGVVCVILRLAVLIEHRVCDRRTDTRTDRGPSVYRASIASHGNSARHFSATVCKTFRPVLSDRCLSVCPVCDVGVL